MGIYIFLSIIIIIIVIIYLEYKVYGDKKLLFFFTLINILNIIIFIRTYVFLYPIFHPLKYTVIYVLFSSVYSMFFLEKKVDKIYLYIVVLYFNVYVFMIIPFILMFFEFSKNSI